MDDNAPQAITQPSCDPMDVEEVDDDVDYDENLDDVEDDEDDELDEEAEDALIDAKYKTLCQDIFPTLNYCIFRYFHPHDHHLVNFINARRNSEELRVMLWYLAYFPSDGPEWQTDQPVPRPNLPAAPTHFDLRTQVGDLMLNAAPPSYDPSDPNQKPWSDRTLDPPAPKARRRHALTYLEPRPHPTREGEIQWFWADEVGNPIDCSVTVIHVLTKEHVIRKVRGYAIEKRDEVVVRHAIKYNTEMAASMIRYRLAALENQGTSILDPETNLDFPIPEMDRHFISPRPLGEAFRRELRAPGPIIPAETQARVNRAFLYFLLEPTDEEDLRMIGMVRAMRAFTYAYLCVVVFYTRWSLPSGKLTL